MKQPLLIALICLVLPTTGRGQQTWFVDAAAVAPGNGSADQPFTAIQSAANVTGTSDEILVAPGVYVGDVTLADPQVALRSRAGAQVTTIWGTVRAQFPASHASVEGFTIHGSVLLFESDLRRCIVSGTGVNCDDGSGVDHCVLTHCTRALFVSQFAGGSVLVSNSILYENTVNVEGPALFVSCCWNATGWPFASLPGFNVSPVTSDPLFFDAAGGDYHLSANSPCIAPDIGVFPFDAAYPTYASEECFGDGSASACPCGNESASLDRAGCRNATGAGGTLRASGSASLFAPSVVLHGASMPEGPLLYFQGTSAAPAFPFGNGIKCTGGALIRLGIRFNVGGASVFPDPAMPPLSIAGFVNSPGSRTYQARYRDIQTMCSAENFNYTNAVRIDWHE